MSGSTAGANQIIRSLLLTMSIMGVLSLVACGGSGGNDEPLQVGGVPSEGLADDPLPDLASGTDDPLADLPSGTIGNTSPVSSDQSVYMSSAGRLAKSIYLAASDADLDELGFTIVSQPEHGNLSGTGAHQEYLPANNFIGTDSFTYKASDAYGESNTATVSIEVTGNDCTSDAFDGPSDSLLVHVPSHLAFEDLAGGNRVTITGNILSEAASIGTINALFREICHKSYFRSNLGMLRGLLYQSRDSLICLSGC